MTRFGPSLLVLIGLLPGIAVSAATTPPAATSPAPAATSMAMPGAPETTTAPALPTRGMDMANVEHIYGTPLEKLPAVPAKGSPHHPPITRWIYPTFVVYFEYNHVVHAVTKSHPFKDSTDKH